MPNAKVLSEKQAIVAQLTEKLQKASAGVIVVDYIIADLNAFRVKNGDRTLGAMAVCNSKEQALCMRIRHSCQHGKFIAADAEHPAVPAQRFPNAVRRPADHDWGDNGVGDNKGAPDHVGMVTKVSNNKITVIEGNKNDTVAYREISVNGRYIRGFCLPDYKTAAKKYGKTTVTYVSVNAQQLQNGDSGNAVKVLQASLNALGFNCGRR